MITLSLISRNLSKEENSIKTNFNCLIRELLHSCLLHIFSQHAMTNVFTNRSTRIGRQDKEISQPIIDEESRTVNRVVRSKDNS